MSDATNPTGPNWQPTAGVELKDTAVNVAAINPVLQSFLSSAGLIHLHVFDKPLVVTSGKDRVHATSSKHYRGDAVDIRSADLAPVDQPAFLLLLGILARRFKLSIFDETNVLGEGHYHIEIAG